MFRRHCRLKEGIPGLSVLTLTLPLAVASPSPSYPSTGNRLSFRSCFQGESPQTFPAMPSGGWKKLSDVELRLAQKWFADGVALAEIADGLDRDKSTITRHCVKMVARKAQGRKRALSGRQIDFLERRLHELIVKANGRYHVTAKMLKRSSRMKVSTRRISEALHGRNV